MVPAEPGRQSCNSGQPDYCCSARWPFPPPRPHKPPPLHRQLHEQWSPQSGEFESWWQRTVAPSPCSAEPGFSAAASFGICAIANFPFGSRQGIRIGDTDSLTLIIHNLNSWRPTFTTSDQSRMRLPALTAL
jgi:hypothetical protein